MPTPDRALEREEEKERKDMHLLTFAFPAAIATS
jgi:hypothetical protein